MKRGIYFYSNDPYPPRSHSSAGVVLLWLIVLLLMLRSC